MGILTVKPGVSFDDPAHPGVPLITAAGFRLLGAIEFAVFNSPADWRITSGTDGIHSGPDDPHKRGCAYDVNTHDLTTEQKQTFVRQLIGDLLERGTVEATSGGWATDKFFAFVEDPGTENEHVHAQLRHGESYP